MQAFRTVHTATVKPIAKNDHVLEWSQFRESVQKDHEETKPEAGITKTKESVQSAKEHSSAIDAVRQIDKRSAKRKREGAQLKEGLADVASIDKVALPSAGKLSKVEKQEKSKKKRKSIGRMKKEKIEKVKRVSTLADVAAATLALRREAQQHEARKLSSWKTMVEPLTKREYYVNKITGQAVWENPMKWKSATADNGRIYWYRGNETTWEDPTSTASDDPVRAPPGFA